MPPTCCRFVPTATSIPLIRAVLWSVPC